MQQRDLAVLAITGMLSVSAVKPAVAGLANSFLDVRVRVETGCTIGSAVLDFGTYIAGQSQPLSGQTEITVDNCPVGTLSLQLDGGRAGNVSRRQMTGENGERLSYQLYRDPNMKNVLGQGKQALSLSLGSASSAVFTVYGLVPGGQKVSPGVYSDTVLVVLDF
jgi:spore coat protein U-like protein